MHAMIVKNKMAKIKQNLQAYMNANGGLRRNDNGAQMARMNSQPSSIQAPSLLNNPSQKNSSKSKNQIELESIHFSMKKYESGEMSLKYSKEDGLMSIYYIDETNSRCRLDIRRDDLKGKRIQCDLRRGSVAFAARNLMIKKADNTKNGLQWINDKRQKQSLFQITFKDRDQVKTFKESSFCQGLVENQGSNSYLQNARVVQPIAEQKNETEDDGVNPKFVMPTPQKLAQTQRTRRMIKQMKEQDKITVLMDIFKIKKQYEDPSGLNKKLKCPVFICGKTYRETQQLKFHLKQKHPELGKHGIQLTQYDGSFQYGTKALDLALYLGKLYPTETKKIVKLMKTRTTE